MKSSKIDWAAYNEALKQRGNITFWVSDDAVQTWYASPTGKKGSQLKYTDLAIETSLTHLCDYLTTNALKSYR